MLTEERVKRVKPGDVFWTRGSNLYLVLEASDEHKNEGSDGRRMLLAMLIGGDDSHSKGRTWLIYAEDADEWSIAGDVAFDPTPVEDWVSSNPGTPFVAVVDGEELMVVQSITGRLFCVDGRYLGELDKVIPSDGEATFYRFLASKFGGFPDRKKPR